MIPYILFLILELLCYSKHNYKLMALLMMVFSLIRYDVGWDYMSYVEKVEDFGSLTIYWERFSFIWMWLFSFCNKVNCPHLALAIPGFITLFLIYKTIDLFEETEKSKCDALIVYILWPFLYLGTFSTVRQSLAAALGLLIIYYIIHGKSRIAILLGVINYFVHPSSVVIFILLFLKPGVKFTSLKEVVFYTIITIGIFSSLSLVLTTLGVTQYLFYLDDTDSFGSTLSILLTLIASYLFVEKWNSKSTDLVKDSMLCIIILCFICKTYIFLFLNVSIIARVLDYFDVLLIFVLPYTYKGSKFSVPRKIFVFCLSALFLFYLYNTQKANNADLASSSFVPYKTIFSK